MDPINFAGGSTNLYDYILNDPINLVDRLGLDPGDQFNSIDAAGQDAINYINATSIVLDREFAGTIYQNSDGTYSYTVPSEGSQAGSNCGPVGPNTVGLYHTHGDNDPEYLNEFYSGLDESTAMSSGLKSYLGTPSGSIYSLNPGTGWISVF